MTATTGCTAAAGAAAPAATPVDRAASPSLVQDVPFPAEPTAAASAVVPVPSSMSRKERKRAAAAIRAQLLGLHDDAPAADEFDPATAFPLGLPMDVVEFHVLQFCCWPSLLALQFAYPRVAQLLGAGDTAWERLFRQMNFSSSEKWRHAKKRQLAVAKNPRTTWRDRVKYCLGGVGEECAVVGSGKVGGRGERSVCASASAGSSPAFSADARRGLLRVSTRSGYFNSLSREQIECAHLGAVHDTTLHCFFCTTCALKVPEVAHMLYF